jgi:UDP-glucose 4-epimerase
MQSAGCDKLVFSSTCAVFGDIDRLPIDSNFPTRPINLYGRTKLMVEQILAGCNQAFNLSSVLLRYFNAAGAELEVRSANAISLKHTEYPT